MAAFTACFRSESAAASLKLKLFGACAGAQNGFRSESAAASLKHLALWADHCRRDRFPQRIRCGLIEALQRGQVTGTHGVSAANPLRPH